MEKLCTYCDSPATTKDHVPPRAIFAKPRPTLVTVPCCEECNKVRFSKADEEFSLFAALMADYDSDKGFCDKVSRAVRGNGKFQRILKSNVGQIPAIDSEGKVTDTLTLIPWPKDHLERMLERIVLGLMRHHYGQRLYGSGYCELDLSGRDLSSSKEFQEVLAECRWSQIGHTDEFVYRHGQCIDHPLATFWEIVLYRKRCCYAITSPLVT